MAHCQLCYVTTAPAQGLEPRPVVINSHVPCQLGDTGSNVRAINHPRRLKSVMPYKSAADERAAARRRYSRNAAIREHLVKRKSEVRDRNRAYVNKIKTETPCADCGVSYPPYVMQFDHLGEDKDRDIATLTRSPVSLARLMAEIAKCEVVCANCHAERTHKRRVLVAQEGFEPSSPGL